MPVTDAAAGWAEALAAWAIPEQILDAAPQSPWHHSPAMFQRAAEMALAEEANTNPSRRVALDALPGGGSVLDVGAGGGAASLPLAPPAALLTAVDQSPAMLEVFAEAADERAVSHREVKGSWPEVSDQVEAADVVVCHNVAYNVAGLVPFTAALTDNARARVVLELTAQHPLSATSHLWQAIHGVERPTTPTADDAIAVLEETGLEVHAEAFERPSLFTGVPRADRVALARRQLCVGPERDAEIDALLDTGHAHVLHRFVGPVVGGLGFMTGSQQDQPPTEELSFLASPGEVCDWRLVVVHDAAAEAGILERLVASPTTPAELGEELGLDEFAVRVVLQALAVWDVVAADEGERFSPGSAWPDREASAALRHHARAIRGWSAKIDDRLRGTGPPAERTLPPRTDLWLEALAVRARHAAPALIDACLDRIPRVRRALELGGGHGEYGLELARHNVEVTMVDRPAVIALVRPRLEPAGIVLHAGDFLEALPRGPFDLVLCAGVNHTYDGEGNRAMFHQAASVTAPGGAVAILTYLRGRDPVAPIFAVQMLMTASGADTHAEDDYRAWLAQAGYAKVEIADDAHPRESLLLATRVAAPAASRLTP